MYLSSSYTKETAIKEEIRIHVRYFMMLKESHKILNTALFYLHISMSHEVIRVDMKRLLT